MNFVLFINSLDWLPPLLNYYQENFLRELVLRMLIFFVPSTLLFFVFFVWGKDYFEKIKIQAKPFKANKVRHEIFYSSWNRVVLAMTTLLIYYLAYSTNSTLAYSNISQYGLIYLVFSIPLAILLHDLYFYVVHRIMHHKLFMRRVHQVHHVSLDPTPFASYSFHPWESIIEYAFLVGIIFVVPLHPITYIILNLFILGFNMYGHLGYEITPKWWVSHPIFKYINTPTNHNMHHSKFNWNFGLYTNIWDRIFKTHHPEYEKTFLKIKSRSFEAVNPMPMDAI